MTTKPKDDTTLPSALSGLDGLDEQALDKAAREGYAVRCKTNGPRVLDQYASSDIMRKQLDAARVIVSAYLDALSVPAAAVVGEPVAWRCQMGDQYWHYFTKEPRHKEPGEVWEPLYAAPSAPEGWQPIETAPKGPEILLFEQCDEMPATWVGRWFDPDFDDGYWTDTFDLKVAGHPTHWRPLPAPPALGGQP